MSPSVNGRMCQNELWASTEITNGLHFDKLWQTGPTAVLTPLIPFYTAQLGHIKTSMQHVASQNDLLALNKCELMC